MGFGKYFHRFVARLDLGPAALDDEARFGEIVEWVSRRTNRNPADIDRALAAWRAMGYDTGAGNLRNIVERVRAFPAGTPEQDTI